MKRTFTCKFHFRGPQSPCDTNLKRNTWWEKSKNVQFCNILSTLQLFINIVAVNKVVCDKFTSQVVPGSEFCIV